MCPLGVQFRLRMLLAGQSVVPEGDVYLHEDVHEGCSLRFQLGAETARPVALGAPVELGLEPADEPGGTEVTHRLWCRSACVSNDGTGTVASLEAADPLAFCTEEQQFRTYAGNVSLMRLAEQVLARQPGSLEELWAFTGAAPTVPQEWLLQCQESGSWFLRRVAASLGHILYWNREEFTCSEIGKGPQSGAPPVDLRFGASLLRLDLLRAPDFESQSLLWVHPASRAVQRLSFPGRGLGQGAAEGLAGRLSSCARPLVSARVGAGVATRRGLAAVAETTCADVGLGARVRLPDGNILVVERIEHRIHAQGSYLNRITCIPEERWAMGVPNGSAGVFGPFQAEVCHNADPLGQGRVRVILSEDIDRRPSPWITFASPVAGPGTGAYWLPEVGDLVLVVAEAACPENLYCIGALRGKDQKAKQEWRSDTNAVKVWATRNGLQVSMNDEEQIIRLETPASALELRGDGEVRLIGKRLRTTVEDEVSITGSRRVKIDADRIDLGL